MPQKERCKYPRAKVACPVIMENNRYIMSFTRKYSAVWRTLITTQKKTTEMQKGSS
jgi:hypothetical protein